MSYRNTLAASVAEHLTSLLDNGSSVVTLDMLRNVPDDLGHQVVVYALDDLAQEDNVFGSTDIDVNLVISVQVLADVEMLATEANAIGNAVHAAMGAWEYPSDPRVIGARYAGTRAELPTTEVQRLSSSVQFVVTVRL